MKKDITALFCFVDDFCKISEQWINKSFLPLINKNPTRKPEISYSEALSHQLCKFREPLNSTIKFDHKMSHSFIPIGDRHRPFFGNIINCQI